MSSRIFVKLFLSLLATFSLLVLLILMIINDSFNTGFTSYLQQKELHTMSKMAPFLAKQYQEQGSWVLMSQNHRRWNEALSQANIPVPLPQRPPPRGNRFKRPQHQLTVPRHSEPTTLVFALRISLYDVANNLVFGPPDREISDATVPIYVEKEQVGWLHLAPSDLQGDQLAQSFIQQQQQNFIYIALIVFMLSAVFAMIGASVLLRPITRIVKAVKRLAGGELSARVVVKGNDEISDLAEDVNKMAKILEKNQELRGQWLSDISHELRTPVAIIKGEIEALLDGLRQPSQERISSLYEETLALAKLIDDLHRLSLTDNKALEIQLQQCDVVKLVSHQVQQYKTRLDKKNLSLVLHTQAVDSQIFSVDSHRLAQLLNNLLENSLRYTDAGGGIEVAVSSAQGLLILSVSDSAPGVCDEDLSKIFDRLYCADKSRSRSVGGSGLGLAICKGIVTAHGGHIHAQHSPLGGISVKIQLPVDTESKRE